MNFGSTDGDSDTPIEGDDVYRDLPPELIATLRDPRVILPGEMEVYENVGRWVDASASPGPSVYIDAQGNTLPVRSDT